MDEIPCCDHSNEISFTVLSRFDKLKILIFLEFLLWPLPGVKGLILGLRQLHLRRPRCGARKVTFSPVPTFPRPTICPWVSEDGSITISSCKILLLLLLLLLVGPTWLKNLYFAYTVVLRAIIKAAPFWEQEQFYTGDFEDDLQVHELVQVLLAKSR